MTNSNDSDIIMIPRFLVKDACDYLIRFSERHKLQAKVFKNKSIINLENPKVIESVTNNIVVAYKRIFPKKVLTKLELITYDMGEPYNLDDNTIDYNYTTFTYLNTGYGGGRTQIDKYKVEPEEGKLVIFPSHYKTSITELLNGKAHVLVAWYKNG